MVAARGECGGEYGGECGGDCGDAVLVVAMAATYTYCVIWELDFTRNVHALYVRKNPLNIF